MPFKVVTGKQAQTYVLSLTCQFDDNFENFGDFAVSDTDELRFKIGICILREGIENPSGKFKARKSKNHGNSH